MNNLIWLLRASRWARKPPSMKMVKLVYGLVAAAIVIVVLEKSGYWPDWATLERGRGARMPR
ncbi:hypothetical protein [Paracoccus sediminicola]|uniref:hypothetical protein n=1 Tax=Paracoccus sediminicola TaxID=3017783 RepID=UPI0022F11241|nr:hypothetical protein [Paracoccus sediminicola]WBU57587.1 hypothetical protein PAF18_03890 [Paracoccus sediminicola]